MARCSVCQYVIVDEASIDLSCQAMARCEIHPEWDRFQLYGNGCDDGEELKR